jgi:hypothetical protein
MPGPADALIDRAVTTYQFRRRGPFEGRAAYLAALVDHVESRDFAAAHELRVGRVQGEWTPADVTAFYEHMKGRGATPPRETLKPGTAIPLIELPDRYVVTEGVLLDLAARGLDVWMETRRADPAREIPILIHVLMTDGRLFVAPVARGDRVAVLTTIARTSPLYGFIVLADVFIHGIDAAGGHATKTDALVAHVGTRDLRRMMTRPYRVVDGHAVFLDAPPDVDKRGAETLSDPYAGVFAMPAAPGRVS